MGTVYIKNSHTVYFLFCGYIRTRCRYLHNVCTRIACTVHGYVVCARSCTGAYNYRPTLLHVALILYILNYM